MSTQLKHSAIASSSLLRPRFMPGQMLLDEDLTAAVDYNRNLTRLLFRSLFGCGVICGFDVKAEADKCGNLVVNIGPGIALDCMGDPIDVCETVTVGKACEQNYRKSPLWLTIRKVSPHLCAPRDIVCPVDEESAQCGPTREKDCYAICISPETPALTCGCPAAKVPAPASVTAVPAAPDGGLNSDAAVPVPPTNGHNNGSAEYWRDFGEAMHRDLPCNTHHYTGVCSCGCCDDSVALARLVWNDTAWSIDNSVRRFVRPVLAPNPFWK